MSTSSLISKRNCLDDNSPIHTLVVTLRAHDLRCQVIRRPAQRPSDVGNLLGETKICYFQVSVAVQQQVLGLQVAIYDVGTMQVVQRQSDFCRVELGYGVGEALNSSSQHGRSSKLRHLLPVSLVCQASTCASTTTTKERKQKISDLPDSFSTVKTAPHPR